MNFQDDKHRPKIEIFLIGSYGRGNIGDDLFLHCATALLGDRHFFFNSYDNALLPSEIGPTAHPLSTKLTKDFWKKLRAFMQAKKLVYWGGDLWVELIGDRFPRRPLYKMLILNLAGRLFGKKIYYVGVGVGELEGLSLWLARTSARMATKILMREKRSANLPDLGNVIEGVDMAVNLSSIQPVSRTLPGKGEKFAIGISLRYHIPEPKKNFLKLAQELASFIDGLPSDRFRFILMPMAVNENATNDDVAALEQVYRKVSSGHDVEIFKSAEVESFIAKTRELNLMIGVRLHSNIIATLNALPCIGLSYRPKVRSFFAENNLENYCVDINKANMLPKVFNKLYENYDRVAKEFLEAGEANQIYRKQYQDFAKKYF